MLTEEEKEDEPVWMGKREEIEKTSVISVVCLVIGDLSSWCMSVPSTHINILRWQPYNFIGLSHLCAFFFLHTAIQCTTQVKLLLLLTAFTLSLSIKFIIYFALWLSLCDEETVFRLDARQMVEFLSLKSIDFCENRLFVYD